MAVDIYLAIYAAGGQEVAFSDPSTTVTLKDGVTGKAIQDPTQLTSFSDDIEQTGTIGSQSSGAGAGGTGKVTFNPLSVTFPVNGLAPILFEACAAGTRYDEVRILLRKTAETVTAATPFLEYGFKVVIVKTVAWSADSGDEAVTMTVTFEYGAMQVSYAATTTTGNQGPYDTQSWSALTNTDQYPSS